jgi:hypothetical protein
MKTHNNCGHVNVTKIEQPDGAGDLSPGYQIFAKFTLINW